MRTGSDIVGGLTVPLVTPMEQPGRPSAAAARPLLTALAAAGVQRLMLLGSNGEGPLLPTASIGEFVRDTIRSWQSLVTDPVVSVNVTAAGTLEALERGLLARAAGADAIVLSPPIYFRHSDEEIVAHYRALEELELPLIAYNAPRYSNPITPAVADALLGMEHVVGIKDSSGDLEVLGALVDRARHRAGFAVGQGSETLIMAGLARGAHGIVPGVANIAPAAALRLLAAHAAGDTHAVQRLQDLHTSLTRLHQIRRGTAGVKAVLSLLHLCPPAVSPPLLPTVPQEEGAFREFIAQHADDLLHPTKG